MNSTIAFSQGNCETVYQTGQSSSGCDLSQSGPYNEGQCDPINDNQYILRAYIHIVTDDNGNGGQPLSAISNNLEMMVRAYAPIGIAFSFEDVLYIKNSKYFNFEPTSGGGKSYEDLVAESPHSNALDIYFLPPGIWDNGRGEHLTTSCVIGGGDDCYTLNGIQYGYCCGVDLITSNITAHEVGHNLGLLHTHSTIFDDASCDNGLPAEDYDPTNCNCGDLVVDTGFDLILAGEECVNCSCVQNLGMPDCPYSGSDFPATPPIENIMSYSPHQCRESFSLGQGYRIKRYLDNCLDINSIVSEGPLRIANGLEFTYDFPYLDCFPEIVVAPEAKLNIEIPMEFIEGKGIIIEGGGTVAVEGVTLSGCNGGTWRGIDVFGSRTTPQIPTVPNGQGHLRLESGSQLLNAEYPIKATGGARVYSPTTTFQNCGPVSFSDYQLNNYSLFSGCFFDRDSGYPFSHYAQFRLENMGQMSISSTTFTNTIIGNNHFAIEAIDSRFSLSSSSVIEGYLTGVMAYSWFNSAFTNFSIRNSTFRGNGTGIAVWSNENFTIRDNIFESIGSFTGASIHNGLMMRRCPSFTVAGNTFKGMPGAAQTIGSLTYRSGTQFNLILDNSYESLNVAYLAESLNHNPIVRTIGLQYWCNSDLTNNHDFVVFDDGIAISQGNGNATLNTFSHVIMDFDNMASNGNGPNGEIDYFHDGTPSSTPDPDKISGINRIFSQTPVDCSVGGNGGGNDSGGTGMLVPQDEQALIGDFNTAKYNHDQQKQIYSSLPSGDPQIPVLERQMAESKGTMHRIADRILRSELSDTVSLDLPKIRTWLLNKESLEAEYSVVETYLYERDSVLARVVRDSIPVKYPLTTAQTSEHADFVQLSELAIDIFSRGNELLSLPPDLLNNTISVADNGTGIAAAKAQGLLNFGYGYNYQLIPKVPNSPQGLIINPGIYNQTKPIRQITAYPNPAKDQVTFSYSLPEDITEARLEITDVNGRIILLTELKGERGKLKWQNDGYPIGVYLYRIKYESGTSSTYKLVLTHR